MLKKIQCTVFCFLVLAGAALMAQTASTDIRVVAVPMVKVYLGPAKNGTEEESEYFTRSLVMEFTAAGYQIVDTMEDSDYNLTLEVSRYPDSPPNGITLVLYETASGREVISQAYGYGDLTDMDTWNLYAITQMMSNTPIIKIKPDAEMLGVMAEVPPAKKPEEPPERWRPALYLGVKAGGIFDNSFIQNSGGYEGGVGRGFGGEAALVAEFQPFRSLSLQTEAVIIYDIFTASRITQGGGKETRFTDTFQSLTLMIPLWIKIPVMVDGFVLSPFAGAYYLLPLDVLDTIGSSKTEPPFGLSLGLEWGIRRNSGMLFFGLRFDHDIGMSNAGEDDALRYSRKRIEFFAGYKFSLGGRGERGGTAKEESAL
jgi:hypothetical protein